MSNGQEPVEVVKARAAHNACKKRGNASKALFQLARDLKAVEQRIGREAEIAELKPFFDEWYRLSQPFLNPEKPRDDYFAEFIAGLRKVRVPTGEGDTINKALEAFQNFRAPICQSYRAMRTRQRVGEGSRRCTGNCLAEVEATHMF